MADNYNEAELVAPNWLNADFLQEILQDYEKDDKLKVKSVQFTPATMKGDHYASLMYRTSVTYTKRNKDEQQLSLIIKTMPENESNRKELIGESHVFETEVGMYTEVIPKFQEILRSIGDNTVFGAPCIYYSLEPHKLIIFKDLVAMGYKLVRERFANIDELKVAYSKLAKWHAVSYKILHENSSFFDKYRYSLVHIPNIMDNEFMTGGLGQFIEMLDNVPTLTQYKPYFEAMRGDYIKKVTASFSEYRENPQPYAYYVLCHGDFHGKNMMFKYNAETGKAADCMLLDFQVAFVGSIVSDIIYSIYMLMDSEYRVERFDEILHFFYAIFKETLQKIDFKGPMPNMINVRQQLVEHRYFELFLLHTFLPMWIGFMGGDIDMSDALDSAECRRKLYYNKYYLAELHRILPKLLHKGYLES